MLSYRRLAAALVVSAGLVAGQARAQKPGDPTNGAGNVSPPTTTPTTLSPESLGRVLRARYPNELVPSKDATPPPHYTLKLHYNPPKTKDEFDWAVTCEVVERDGQCPLARVWFNCQVMPDDADPGRLRALLDWSGGHNISRAFFKTAPHREGTMLSLVAEAPPEDVTEERFPRVLGALFLMAYESKHLWSGKLSEPLAKPAATPVPTTKPAVTAKDLVGIWDGRVFMDDKEVGRYAINFLELGNASVTRADTTVERPKMQHLTGYYTIVEGRLDLKLLKFLGDGKTEREDNVYDVDLDGKALTLTMKQGKSVMKIKLAGGR